jgi:hypothetical protein
VEPISPELVLIDPELARRERERLVERARLVELRREQIGTAPVEPAPALDIGAMRRAVVEATVELEDENEKRLPSAWFRRRAHRRTLAFGMLILLATSSLALGATVGRHRGNTREVTTTAAVRASLQTTRVPSTPPRSPLKPPKAPQPSLAGLVERRVLTELLSRPSKKLPGSLIDRRTRLLRTNVRVTCRRQGSLRFACAVEPPGVSNRQPLRVTVRRRGGKWHFSWPSAR